MPIILEKGISGRISSLQLTSGSPSRLNASASIGVNSFSIRPFKPSFSIVTASLSVGMDWVQDSLLVYGSTHGIFWGGGPAAGSLLRLSQLSERCLMISSQRALDFSRVSAPSGSGRTIVYE